MVGHPTTPASTAADTRAAVEAFIDHGVDVILFVGGDGTATDVATAVTAHDASVPVLGVPAGVKVYSAVFAVQPAAAGRVAATFEDTTTREVSDIDEGAYRDGECRRRSVGSLQPLSRRADALQPAKQAYAGTTGALAAGVADSVRDGVTYVLGPGGTLAEIADALSVSGSPLGVDVYRDGALVVRDGSASEITAALGTDNVVYVSPIGGQGSCSGAATIRSPRRSSTAARSASSLHRRNSIRPACCASIPAARTPTRRCEAGSGSEPAASRSAS